MQPSTGTTTITYSFVRRTLSCAWERSGISARPISAGWQFMSGRIAVDGITETEKEFLVTVGWGWQRR